MKNWIFLCDEFESISFEYLSIMEQESLGSKIDPENRSIVSMCKLGNVYKESVSSEYNIDSFLESFLEFLYLFGCEELIYLSDIA
jgi:hypothetical protein